MRAMNSHHELIYEIEQHMDQAQARYGCFASTHEAIGVALEEWDELREAVHANALGSIEEECIDLASVLIRLALACRTGGEFAKRSGQ